MSHFVNYIPGGRFITIAICFIQKFTIISSFGPIFLFRKIFAKVFISLVVLCFFTPRLKSRRGIAMSMSVRPSLPPSVCRHFTLLAVQGAFLHQLSPFLVCRLVIRLFCGSFNDFEKNLIFWVKNGKIRYGKYAFLVQISF